MASSYDKKDFIPVIKTCEMCGKQFSCDSQIKFRNQKYCGEECRKKAKKIKDKAYHKKSIKAKEEEAAEKAMQKAFDKTLGPVLSPEKVMKNFRKPKKGKETRDYLLEDAMAARANGLSYGKYTAQRYAPTVTIPPEFRR